jgi:RND family efflux transporter MFP subunit
MAAVMVTVEPVTYRPVQRAVEGVGTLHGFEEIPISARVEGRVQKLSFDVADRLKPGELLLQIDPKDYELSVEQAERALQVELAKLGLAEIPGPNVDLGKVPSVQLAQTRMENAQTKFARVNRLANSGVGTAEERDNVTSDYRAAQAEYANQLLQARVGLASIRLRQSALAAAQQQLKDTQVRVPLPTLPVPGAADGVSYLVTHRMVAEGALVRPGTEVCKLVINQTLKLRVPVPERYSSEVRLGQKAEVKMAAYARPFAGTVTRVSPAVEPTTRTFEVEVQVANPGGDLKSGSFAKAAILTRTDAETATVPLSALVNFAGISKIFLVENGRAREVQVTPGVQTTEWVEIASPALPRGAAVITSGQSALAADSPVVTR